MAATVPGPNLPSLPINVRSLTGWSLVMYTVGQFYQAAEATSRDSFLAYLVRAVTAAQRAKDLGTPYSGSAFVAGRRAAFRHGIEESFIKLPEQN